MTSPINPGTVVWSGENPGIYLKDAAGAWQALSVHFRVVTSPHGAGIGSIVLGEPDRAAGWPDAPNLCVSTNEPLMRWLVEAFVSKFASFRGVPALAAMRYLPAIATSTHGDGCAFHEERVEAEGVRLALRWDDLATPFAVDVPPAMSATGAHQMYSVFVEARRGAIHVDGRPLPGSVIVRDFLGSRMSSAFLAFAETWVTPSTS